MLNIKELIKEMVESLSGVKTLIPDHLPGEGPVRNGLDYLKSKLRPQRELMKQG